MLGLIVIDYRSNEGEIPASFHQIKQKNGGRNPLLVPLRPVQNRSLLHVPFRSKVLLSYAAHCKLPLSAQRLPCWFPARGAHV